MQAYEIIDIKTFTAKLFMDNIFDDFLVKNIEIITYNTFIIDGNLQSAYFDEEVKKDDCSKWETLRPICFNLIKGKKTPIGFKIILKLSKSNLSEFIEKEELLAFKDKELEAFLNIRYEDKKLIVNSAGFVGTFIPDKSFDRAWDIYIKNFLEKENIEVNVL